MKQFREKAYPRSKRKKNNKISKGNKLSAFDLKVYAVTKKIPRGRVATYKFIAEAIGSPRSCRAVGNALNKNPFAPQVPCHRVVCVGGRLGGFAGGPRKKTNLLQREGVVVKSGRVDLKKFGVAS